MDIIGIAAIAKNNVIGDKNGLPWHLPSDLKRTKNRTMGHTLLMGRRCFESIGRPLPGRKNFIISRQLQNIGGCHIFSDIEKAIKTAEKDGETELFIFGGGEIYRLALPFINKLEITLLDLSYDGNITFPEIDSSWDLISKERGIPDEKDECGYTLFYYRRGQKNSLNL